MPVTYKSELRRPYYPGHRSSYLELIPEEELEAFAKLEDVDAPRAITRSAGRMTGEIDQMAAAKEEDLKQPLDSTQGNHYHRHTNSEFANDYLTAGGSFSGWSTPGTPLTPGMSRSNSSADGNFDTFVPEQFPPVDRLTMFDILENLALPQRLERMQHAIHDNAEKLRRQRRKLTSRAMSSKNNIVEEWRKRVNVAPEERLDRYRKRMKMSVERLNRRWTNVKTVTMAEKVSFVTATLNIFISAYLIGAWPQYFHYWYTAQLIYYMPIRWYRYHQIGFHYFLADLCYFVNVLLLLSIWAFPQSKRLLIATYCLAFGNNAVAIVMWRNSLVFHSLDKTTTLFIHIMPCATLHVLVHLIPKSLQMEKFPAIHTIKYSAPGAPEHYSIWDMIIWATLPYALWQLSYHFLITVRKRAKIAAGRPTSFTWLKKSYRGNVLGKFVLSFPEMWQETIFMFVQYTYAVLTMLPCPIWFWYRWASATFMLIAFSWASWNGATFYIDVFGRRMEKEMEALKKEVARMTKSPDITGQDGRYTSIGSPISSPNGPIGQEDVTDVAASTGLDLGPAAQFPHEGDGSRLHRRELSTDSFSMLEESDATVKSEDFIDSTIQTPALEATRTLGDAAPIQGNSEKDKKTA